MSYLIEDRAFDVEGEDEEGRGTGIFRSSGYRERMDTVHRSQSKTLKMGMSEMLFSFMPGHNKSLDDSVASICPPEKGSQQTTHCLHAVEFERYMKQEKTYRRRCSKIYCGGG